MTSSSFEFATAGRIVFGPGALSQVATMARSFGPRALIVVGREPGRAERLLEGLAGQGMVVSVFCVPGEPDLAAVDRGVAQAKSEACDLVISFGGGSVIDAGKAIAAMIANPGELLDYVEVIGRGKKLALPSAPFLAIPTTAGTGSEVTRNAVLASPAERVKVSLRSPGMLPKIAIVDPELTWELPRAITAATGLDALTQLIEPYVCSRTNPLTDAVCLEGLRRAGRSLRRACDDGRNPAAREDMALAALFGGLALANAGLGAVHGFAAPVGGMFTAPHGAVCAALLPHVMKSNLQALRQRQPASDSLRRYTDISRILTGAPDAAAEDGISWVTQLVQDLEIVGLGAYGVNSEHVPDLVEKARRASSMKANPIELTSAELAAILQGAL